MNHDEDTPPGVDSARTPLEDKASRIASLISTFFRTTNYRGYLKFWEEHGFHILPTHYYSPIPSVRRLPNEHWQQESELVGIDMNAPMQLHLLRDIFPQFQSEYNLFSAEPTDNPQAFYLDNGVFSGADPLVLYCMVRHYRPRRILEIGGGFSTLVSARAALENGETELISVEPHPRSFLSEDVPGLTSLIEQPVQSLGMETFARLDSGDILFIDSSHVSKYGSDVNYLYLEVLPRLNPGVLVHVHDIFLPGDYPARWLQEHALFFSEQYLLQAFLTFNSQYEVLLSNAYLTWYHADDLRHTFPTATPYHGGASFWMRRKSQGAAESQA
jgi:hypothetical protein